MRKNRFIYNNIIPISPDDPPPRKIHEFLKIHSKGKMASLKTWFVAARPNTLWASIAPVIVGTAMAFEAGVVHWPAALFALLASLWIQIGTNFSNDYFDFIKGADTPERLGPPRPVSQGQMSAAAMRNACIGSFGLATVLGVYLVMRGGWIVLLLGVACIVSGILYTATPYATAYNGSGDIFVVVFFGPVAVGGTYYVQGLTLPLSVLIAGLAPGFIANAILTVNNLRDRPTDEKAGKQTLAVRFGKKFAQVEYVASLAAACCVPIFLYFYTQGHFFSLAALLAMGLALPALKTIFTHTENTALNATLDTTGKILLLFCLLFSVGWNL